MTPCRTCVADEGRVLSDGRRGRRNAHARRHARGRGVALRARRVSASRKMQVRAVPRTAGPTLSQPPFVTSAGDARNEVCTCVRAGTAQRRASQRRTGKGATDLGVGQARRAQLSGPRVRWGAPAQQRGAGGHGATGSTCPGVGAAAGLIVTLARFGSLTVQSAERQARCPWQRAAAICFILRSFWSLRLSCAVVAWRDPHFL